MPLVGGSYLSSDSRVCGVSTSTGVPVWGWGVLNTKYHLVPDLLCCLCY